MTAPFLILAALSSIFYAAFATRVFQVDTKGRHWSWHVHQFWFNLAGGAVGWSALWLLIQRTVPAFMSASPLQLNIWDAFLVIVAFTGVTGHVPYVAAGVFNAAKDLAGKLLGSVK